MTMLSIHENYWVPNCETTIESPFGLVQNTPMNSDYDPAFWDTDRTGLNCDGKGRRALSLICPSGHVNDRHRTRTCAPSVSGEVSLRLDEHTVNFEVAFGIDRNSAELDVSTVNVLDTYNHAVSASDGFSVVSNRADRHGVADYEISLTSRLRGLLAEVGKGEPRSNQSSSCCDPTAEGRYPGRKFVPAEARPYSSEPADESTNEKSSKAQDDSRSSFHTARTIMADD